MQYYEDLELELCVDTGSDYNIHFELIEQIMEWCACENEESCKTVIKNIQAVQGIFLGEFVKAILKINNIANEFESICEILNNLPLLQKVKKISALTMKYVATNQSLYI